MGGYISPQRRVDVVGERELPHLVIILIDEPARVAREAAGHHGIHETRPQADMVVKGDMHACVGRGREKVPAMRRDLEIGVDILGGPQPDIDAGACLKGDEIEGVSVDAEKAQVALQHQGDLGVVEAEAVRLVIILRHFLV